MDLPGEALVYKAWPSPLYQRCSPGPPEASDCAVWLPAVLPPPHPPACGSACPPRASLPPLSFAISHALASLLFFLLILRAQLK